MISGKISLNPAIAGKNLSHKGVTALSETENMNKALARRIYEEMWNQGDPAAAGEIFARPEGVERFVREFLAAFPDLGSF